MMPRPRIALLSNPKSTGNLAQLPRIREYCADHPDLFHYEVEHVDQIGQAGKEPAAMLFWRRASANLLKRAGENRGKDGLAVQIGSSWRAGGG